MRPLFRALWATAFLITGMALSLAAHAQSPAAGKPQIPELLFVQNCSTVDIDEAKGTLTLHGLSPTTLFFSDRPVRIAGHYRTKEYLTFWKNGPDSFLKDPPNATLSVFQKGKDELSDMVVTLRNPRVSGNNITYDITVISGSLPPSAGPASLFIDIIGLPFTPLSFAGVARRTAYRTAVWGSAAAASAAASSAAGASAAAATTHAAPVPVTYTAPAPAPAASSGPSPEVAKLKELKSLEKEGLITEQQYKSESQKLLNQMVQ